jgi:hypothetical protein
LPTTLPELITAYAADGQASSALDGFAASQEFGDLYVRNNASLVNAIYLNGFNRNAELSGIQYWAGFLDRKEIAPAQAVLRILSGAQNDDALVVSKKSRRRRSSPLCSTRRAKLAPMSRCRTTRLRATCSQASRRPRI